MEKKRTERGLGQKAGSGVSSGEDAAESYIRKAYKSLKDGDAFSAQTLLREALKIDFEHREVLYALKCLAWWLDKIKRIDDFRDPYEKGVFILSQWKSYYGFLDIISGEVSPGENVPFSKSEARFPREADDSCQYALKRFVYKQALDTFLAILDDGANQQDPDILLQTGRCCKGAGDWDDALRYLELAGRFRREDSGILSELADVKALLGDERAAKVLFREAFFLEPQGIDLRGMESELVVSLRDRIEEMGYTGPELAEWIPVWGCIWGILSVKRELKPVELGRLKQSILSLENENRSQSGGARSGGLPSERSLLVKPRLLNRYFWLIDYCEHNRNASGLMDETLLKIKFIDPVVYEHYKT